MLARPNLSFAEIVGVGAQRVSVGGSLTSVAVRAMAGAATAIRDSGAFASLDARLPPDQWLSGEPPGSPDSS